MAWFRRKKDETRPAADPDAPAPDEVTPERDGAPEEAADAVVPPRPGDDAATELSEGSQEAEDPAGEALPADNAADDAARGGGRFMGRLRSGLSRSRSAFAEGLGNLLLGQKVIDESVLEDLETQLLLADVGVDATTEIMDRLTPRVQRRDLNDADALMAALGQELTDLLEASARPFELPPSPRPFVILVVGVNGVGKTTTIGKLARRFKDAGHKPILAAGDTFRAAAVQQLQAWGERNEVEVVAQGDGADAASVIFDALTAAKGRGADVVLADTAGRLHNKANLMEELAKVGRVMRRFDEAAPHAVLLVLDAGTGQNALMQAREFAQAVDLTGLVLTKLDGTAKGGIAFALARQTGLPIQFIGVGEQVEDLRPFAPKDFVAALLDAGID